MSIHLTTGLGAVTPKVPRIGYAPSEYQAKPWPREAPIEGWFPLFAREHTCFDLVEDVVEKSRSRRSSRHPHRRAVPMPIADAWPTTGKRARLAARASCTRASHAARADWERTPPLERAGGDWVDFVLTLRSIEVCANAFGEASGALPGSVEDRRRIMGATDSSMIVDG